MAKKIKKSVKVGFYVIVLISLAVVLLSNYSHKEKIDQQTTSTVSVQPSLPVAKKPAVSESNISTFTSQVDRLLKNAGFNGACAVLVDGYPLYKNCIGYANFSTKTKITDTTPFQLASVSKMFTATAILRLYENGALDLHDDVRVFIPEFPYEDITIHQLLTHTAGLQNYMYLVDNYWKDGESINNEDVLNLMIKYQLPLDFTPGRRHGYSNTGYAILALVVERVEHDDFPDWMEENIFSPLDMEDAWVWNSDDYTHYTMLGYTTPRRWRRTYYHDENDEVYGDKGVYCSLNDMVKFEMGIQSHFILTDSLYTLATKPTKIIRKTVPYGYGLRFKEYKGEQVVYHNGLWNGYTSTLTRFPEQGITIILMSNTSSKISGIVNGIRNRAYSYLI